MKKANIFKFGALLLSILISGGVIAHEIKDDISDKENISYQDNHEGSIDPNFNVQALENDYETVCNLYTTMFEQSNTYENPLEVYAAYYVALVNGYLSRSNNFKFEQSDVPYDVAGIGVVIGQANDYDVAYNLCNILRKCGHEAGVVAGTFYDAATDNEISENYHVVYSRDDDFFYLFDPTTNTIFLRNIFGKYRSIYNGDIHFIPNETLTEHEGYATSIEALKHNHADAFSHFLTVKTRFDKYRDAALEEIDAYCEYEEAFIKPYQDQIYDGLSGHSKVYTNN